MSNTNENLAKTAFKQGNDPRRNVTGANRGGKWLTTLLDEALKKISEGNEESYDKLLVKRVLKKAIVDGDMRAIEHIWDRTEGKPAQAIDHTTKGEKITSDAQTLALQAIQQHLHDHTGNTQDK